MTVKARVCAALLLCLVGMGLLVAAAVPAAAGPLAQAAAGELVKYYLVQQAYQGQPENLAEIAARFLGGAGRADDIYHLNTGRRQPDGGALGADRKLRAGWSLSLPWDAVGDGVQYGALPAATPGPTVGGSPRPATTPPIQPKPGNTATPAPSTPPPATSAAGRDLCTATQPAKIRSDWARQRVAVEQAWDRTRGEGILVAIIDSGVDASLPQLAGRVAQGADIRTGSGRGDIDCLGSGTAMASILAARTRTDEPSPEASDAAATVPGEVVGMAPAVTILPIRVVTDTPRSRPADAVTAIEVAVSAGAQVIALGSYVDVADPGVLQALQQAEDHDVVVVVAATTEPGAGAASRSALPEPPKLPGVLRVAGVGPEGQPVAAYHAGRVDVTAPGMDVASLGVGSTGVWASSGSQYAVAVAGGLVALVRSAYPQLDAAQVVHRIEATADGAAGGTPDPKNGFGMINPKAAVTLTLADERTAHPAGRPAGASWLRQLSIALVVLLGALGLGVVLWHTGPWANAARARSEGPFPRFIGVSRAPQPAADTQDDAAADAVSDHAASNDGRDDDEDFEDRRSGVTEHEAAGSTGAPAGPRGLGRRR